MKSREVNRIIEMPEEEGEDSDGQSTDSNLWEDSGFLDSKDEELVREPIWIDEGEVRVLLREPEPAPAPVPVRAGTRQGVRQPAVAVERPLRRSNRKKD
jgi:hypothetical protein